MKTRLIIAGIALLALSALFRTRTNLPVAAPIPQIASNALSKAITPRLRQIAAPSLSPTLTSDRLTRAAEIARDAEDRANAIKARVHWFLTQPEKEEVARILGEAHEKIQALDLTPEELHALDMAPSKNIDLPPEISAFFKPTEAERVAFNQYRLSQIQIQDWNAALSMRNYPRDELEEINRLSHESLEALLAGFGHERLFEYERLIDPLYREALAFATRFDLDPAIVKQIVEFAKKNSRRTLRSHQQTRTAQRNRRDPRTEHAILSRAGHRHHRR